MGLPEDKVLESSETTLRRGLRLIPDYMRDGAYHYVMIGRRPGQFLAAIFCNNLIRAAEHADDENKRLLYEYAVLCYAHTPGGCSGSVEMYESWIDRGGLKGLLAAAKEKDTEHG